MNRREMVNSLSELLESYREHRDSLYQSCSSLEGAITSASDVTLLVAMNRITLRGEQVLSQLMESDSE